MSWENCLEYLRDEIPADEFQTWLRPLQYSILSNNLLLFAPNHFVADWVSKKYYEKILYYFNNVSTANYVNVQIKVGEVEQNATELIDQRKNNKSLTKTENPKVVHSNKQANTLDNKLTFENFIEGKCNILARTAAMQIIDRTGEIDTASYNPFLIYGSTGLGKTHLMHAIGNAILKNNKDVNVFFLNSQKFVHAMVSAIQNNTIEKFKDFYQTVDVLLIDDIQLFAGKARTQEEFFHIFNFLIEGQKQIIMTCDTFPKEVEDIEERLKSRFSWGLSVGIEMPDVETRVAILTSKAAGFKVELPQDVAFFIAQNIRSNIRELEGALKRVLMTSRFLNSPISIASAQEALKDLLSAHEKLISLENIQKTVSQYYKIRIADLHSKKRTRNITRPRQLAMYLSRELTKFSVSEIGDAYGGRDHTTVLNACKTVKKLILEDTKFNEDYINLKRTLIGG